MTEIMKLKVCGMKYQDNIIDVAALQPDYLGFIYYDKSKRFFKGEIPELPGHIKKVGVFVDASIEFIMDKIEKDALEVIQLHGNETPGFCKKLKDSYHSAAIAFGNAESMSSTNKMLNQVQHDTNIEIIKVFSIKDSFNFSVLEDYQEVCDYYLFDTKGKLPGGNGFTFDWNLLNEYPSNKPFFLSGGIGMEEIENLKEFLKSKASKYCHAIDVNSKFEIEPGLKKVGLLEEFKKYITSSGF
jgi:phosphoribosylanthranilate isomerase